MKTKDEWLDDMELRLKRALLDVVDSNEEEGQRFLNQEISSHLEDINGESARFDYLLSLQERFPQLLPDETDPELEKAVYDQLKQPESPSVEEALEILRRDWDLLDEETQEGFLREVSFDTERGMTGATPSFESPSDELARFLKLPEDTSMSVERIQSAMIGLLKTVSQVDSLGTQVYKQLGMSRDLSVEDIRKLIGAYVEGNSIDVDQMNQVLNETRLKIGLIISSIANLPASLCQSHLAKFQPTLIEQSVAGGGLLGGKEAKCWKKYVTLAEDIQPQKVEKAINDLMIKQLKRIKGR